MRVARPTKYTDDMQRLAEHYLSTYSDYSHEVPSAVGLCKVLGVARSTLYKWADEIPDFADVIEAINESQELVTINKSLVGDFNATISKLLLANHGYHDKSDSDVYVNADVSVSELSPAEAKAINDSLESEC